MKRLYTVRGFLGFLAAWFLVSLTAIVFGGVSVWVSFVVADWRISAIEVELKREQTSDIPEGWEIVSSPRSKEAKREVDQARIFWSVAGTAVGFLIFVHYPIVRAAMIVFGGRNGDE